MKNPKIKTKVVHSNTKSAWNIIGMTIGNKYKVAVLPYVDNVELAKEEAFQHAEFISYCFNQSDVILNQKGADIN